MSMLCICNGIALPPTQALVMAHFLEHHGPQAKEGCLFPEVERRGLEVWIIFNPISTPRVPVFNPISTPFQPHFNPISTPFQPHFNLISTPRVPGLNRV